MTYSLRPASLALAFLLPCQAIALETLSYDYSASMTEETKSLIERDSVLAQSRVDGNTEPQDILAAARADYTRLIGILNAGGHYAGHVSIKIDGAEAYDLSPFAAPEDIRNIEVSIDPGPEFVFETFKVSPLPQGPAQLDIPTARERAESGRMRDAVLRAVEAWKTTGHAEARVARQEIVADHKRHTVRADITIDPGPAYRIGELRPDPSDPSVPERVKAVANLAVGAPYSPEHVASARSRLERSGVYRSVSFDELPDPKSGVVNIETTLVPQKKRRMTAGVEIASPGGLTLSAGWMHRNYKRQLQTLSFDSELRNILDGADAIDLTLGAELERPAVLFPDTDLTLSSSFEFLQEPTFSSQSIDIGASLARDFGNDWIGSAGTSLGHTLIQDDLGERSTTDLSFPLSLTLDRRDNTLDPTSGYRFGVTATPILLLDSGKAATQATFDIRRYLNVGSAGNTILAGRFQGGTMFGAGYADVPPDLLFHSGGGGTVRGHAYQGLSITRRPGVETGGTSFLGASFELRQAIRGALGGVAFADAGWLGTTSLPGSDDPWQAGAGVGLRYDTPVGPARFDIAFPVKGESTSPFHIYLGIGQSF